MHANGDCTGHRNRHQDQDLPRFVRFVVRFALEKPLSMAPQGSGREKFVIFDEASAHHIDRMTLYVETYFKSRDGHAVSEKTANVSSARFAG